VAEVLISEEELDHRDPIEQIDTLARLEFENQGKLWQLRSLLVTGEEEQYKEAISSHLAKPEVQGSLRGILSFDRSDLLGKIEAEFRQAAIAERARATAIREADAEDEQSIEESPKPTECGTADCIESLGERRYRVGDQVCVLTLNEDLVLQAFLHATGQSHTKPTLADMTQLDESVCVRVLRELRGSRNRSPKYDSLFTPFIKLPGKKGWGLPRSHSQDLSAAHLHTMAFPATSGHMVNGYPACSNCSGET
jgi:hypothetical protein